VTVTRVGCTGWSYADWVGPFYPPGTPPGEFLSRYAQVFDFAEVDSSFYRAPSPFLAQRWVNATPDPFLFALKIPQAVSHATPGSPIDLELGKFLQGIGPLQVGGKLGPVVAQFPASFRRPAGVAHLQAILDAVPRSLRLAVELRHRSWWVPETQQQLEARGAGLVWSVVPSTRPPYWITSDFVYGRFVGDRALTTFDRIQRDERDQMELMRDHLLVEGASAAEHYLLVNNHFMGFGPGTAAIVREVLGLPPVDLEAARRPAGQHALGEFGEPS